METNVVLVLLVGLPASGKTTLCRTLKAHHDGQHGQESSRLRVIHVCYDDLISLSLQREFVEQKRNEQGNVDDWRGTTEDLVVRVKGNEDRKNIEEDKEYEERKMERQSIGENWKSARHDIHSLVDQLVQFVMSGKIESGVKDFFGIPLEALESDAKYAIILDDNFYYRSMRYEFFQLARRHSAAFCQLYLECTIEEAVQHNSSREEKVPADVVTVMGERLQIPQPHLHSWEANTHVLKERGRGVCKAWDVVVASFQHGLTPLQDRKEEVAEARRRCSQSVVHQADLCLRKLVKHLVKEGLEGEKGKTASQLGAHINAARQTVLADLRRGALEVPACLADTITQGNRQELEAFLTDEIKKRIA